MTQFKVGIAIACMGFAFAGCATKKSPEAAAAPAAAPEAAPVIAAPMVESTARSLNIRATPSPTGAVVGSLKLGDRASAPQPAAGGWTYVETAAGAKGYVASQYIRAVEASATPPAAAPAPAVTPPAKSAEPAAREPAPGTPLARVTAGMTEAQVIEILGAPTSQQSYITGKAFIPFYYGTDMSRLDYRYKGVGIVAFSRNQYSGGTKVIRVDADPSEDGLP